MEKKRIVVRYIKNAFNDTFPDAMAQIIASTMPWFDAELISPVIRDFRLGINNRFSQLINKVKYKN